MNSFRKAAFLFVAVVILCGTGQAQSSRGTILGTVRDATGAAIPGVSVTVTNTGTNIARTSISNEAGDYVFPEMNIGTYAVSGELPGFKMVRVSGLQLDVDQRLRADLTLQVGEITDKVEVMADAQLVAADSATVGTVVENRRMVELPLNKRDILQLALLVPGAVGTFAGSNLSAQGGGISVNGFRETMNNIMLDGIEAREMGINQISVNLAVDAMAEMKVQSSSYSAEYGRQAGAQINMTTKSGTNEFHGTVYEFLRNGHLDAKNFFDPSFYPKPQYLRNVYGVSFGGPIRRDKTFFFVNYDGTRLKQGVTRTGLIPTALERNGNFAQSPGVVVRNPYTGQPFPGNIIPDSMIDPVGRKIAALYPLPNLPNPLQNYVSSPSNINNRNQYTIRIDHKISDKDSLFGRYTYNDEFLRNPFGRSAATSACTTCIGGPDGIPYGEFSYIPGQVAGISWTHVFSPRLFNEARIGFNRLDGGIYPGHYGLTNGTAPLGIRNTQNKCPTRCGPDATALGYPSFSVTGFSGIGEGGDQDRRDNTFLYNEGIYYNTGSHSIKTGGEYRKFQKNRTDSGGQGSFTFNGTYTNVGLADLLLGLPFTASQNIPQLGYSDNIAVHTRQSGIGWYIQDDWRFNSRLTLNLGLRWDATSPGAVSDNKQTNFDFKTGQLIFASKEHRYLVPWDLNNFGPRFGFAWTPFAGAKTVIRGGYGVFFDAKTNVTWNGFATNPPYTNGYTYQNTAFGVAGPFAPRFTLTNMFPDNPKSAASAPTISYTMLEVGKKLPDGYGQQFSFNIQRELAPSLIVEAGYVGSKGTSLDSSLALNQPAPAPGTIASRRPYPQYTNLTLDTAQADSNYHSLQLRVEKRYSGGLSFLTSYTFARNIDNTSTTGGGPLNPFDLRADRGLSNNDVRQRFAYSYTWDLPFKSNMLVKGWQVSGVVSIQTGQPLTITIPTDRANVGRTGQRPDLLGNPNLPRSQRQPSRWYDASVFATPALYAFGNAGRNIVEGPGVNNIDLSLSRNFLLGEQRRLQFRGEMFNIANHPNFNNPSISLNSSPGLVSGAKESRQIQFGMKFYF